MRSLLFLLIIAALIILTWDQSLRSRFSSPEPTPTPAPIAVTPVATPHPKMPFFAEPSYSPSLGADSLPSGPRNKAH